MESAKWSESSRDFTRAFASDTADVLLHLGESMEELSLEMVRPLTPS